MFFHIGLLTSGVPCILNEFPMAYQLIDTLVQIRFSPDSIKMQL